MKNIKVREARKLITLYPSIVREDAFLKEVVEGILKDPKTRAVYVVDREEKLLGIIDIRRVIRYIFPHFFEEDLIGREVIDIITSKTVKDFISYPPVWVTEDDNLDKALRLMIENELEEIPVVDKDLRVIGDLNLLELLSIWIKKY